ncbi:MAG: nucleoside-diphosphate sugar epimerase/dehydratase [Pseudomonadota bacterium]
MNQYPRVRILTDLLITAATAGVAYVLAYLLRFDFEIDLNAQRLLFITLPIVILSKFLFTFLFALHRRAWRYVSLVDALDVLKASSAGSALFAAAVLLLGNGAVPRSVYLMDWFLFPTLLVGCRVVARVIFERGTKKEEYYKRVLVIGAGGAGQALIKELMARGGHLYEPIGILDDNQNKRGLRIHGVPVRGSIDDFEHIARLEHADEAIVACHQLSTEKMGQIFQMSQNVGIPLKRIPRLEDILEGSFSPLALKDVEVEDLLPRSGVSLLTEELAQFYCGKTVLVTGAGGSIGSELVRQLCGWAPKAVICLERNEFNLYEIDRELKERFSGTRTYSIIGDVCDGGRVEHVLAKHKPEIVFHAAAYKHVPLMEANASEALKNNLLGTEVVASLSMKHGVERFILISTDKAVEPFNVMGYTKRVAELLLEEKFACSSTKFMAVRFGNVLASAGSVIPLFRQQIAHGGPVTVTHPEVERYFMTIPEAVQLVLKSAHIGKGGEIFVLDMGKPVKIVDLAKKMIALSGMNHVQIKFIGLRPGEKLTEELVSIRERTNPTKNPKISAIYPEKRTGEIVSGCISALVRDVDDMSNEEVLRALQDLVEKAEDRVQEQSAKKRDLLSVATSI